MTRGAQKVYSELAQFGNPRGLDLSLCRRLWPLVSRCAYLQCHLTVANARSLMRWSAPTAGCASSLSYLAKFIMRGSSVGRLGEVASDLVARRGAAKALSYQRSLLLTHKDRAGDPPGRRGAAGDVGHRKGFPTHSGGSPARPERRLPETFGLRRLRLAVTRTATPRAPGRKPWAKKLGEAVSTSQ
jgi:hypothetical protein